MLVQVDNCGMENHSVAPRSPGDALLGMLCTYFEHVVDEALCCLDLR